MEKPASTMVNPTTRYRCGFPGCMKRYASTDGVRKHARKTHSHWLKTVDEQSLSRDRQVESKPSTYCIMEVEDQNADSSAAANPMPLLHPRGDFDEGVSMHRMAQASIAAATAACLMPRDFYPPTSMASVMHHHPAMFARVLQGTVECSRRPLPSDFHDGMHMRSMPGANEGPPPAWMRDRMPPSDMLPEMPHSPEHWNNEFRALLAKVEAANAPAPASAYELDGPLCLTPPTAPVVNTKRVSPFELDEKRPAKAPRIEPKQEFLGAEAKGQGRCEEFMYAPPECRMDPAMLLNEESPITINEAEYFDFVEALLAM